MTDDPAYFLYHSIGLYPDKATDMARAMAAFSDIWAANDDSQWPTVLAARDEYLGLWRDLIAAPQGTVTSSENVTTALLSVVTGLADRLRGRVVLVAADCFPSLHFLLNGLSDRLGFTLRTVPLRDGEAWVRDDDLIAAWDGDVALTLLTFVTSTASHRCDLRRLIAHGHAQGSVVGVDLTQGIGILPFSLDDTPADFAVSTTLKWLCGPPGAGMIYMRAGLIEEARPELRGWFSQPNPFSWDLEAFDYAPDARRFDHGTPSVIACLAAIPALRWHAAQDHRALLEQNRALSQRIIDNADARGWQLASPRDDRQRGGSVMLRLPDGIDGKTLIDDLRSRAIYADCRGPVLRLSPGIVTRADHIDRLFATLDELTAR
jgi:kynureninase